MSNSTRKAGGELDMLTSAYFIALIGLTMTSAILTDKVVGFIGTRKDQLVSC